MELNIVYLVFFPKEVYNFRNLFIVDNNIKEF